MANIRALTYQSGNLQQIQDANKLIVGAGVVSSTGPLSVGTVGSLTTVPGTLQVNDKTTLQAQGAGVGSLFDVNPFIGSTLIRFTDNNTQVVRSATPNGASAIGTVVDTSNDLTNATAVILSVQNLGVPIYNFQKSQLAINNAPVQETLDGISTAQTYGVQLVNTTAATIPTPVQWSPGLMFTAERFDGATSHPIDWIIQASATGVGTTIGTTLALASRYNGGAWTPVMNIVDDTSATFKLQSAGVPGTYVQIGSNILLSASGGIVAAGANERLGWVGPGQAWGSVTSNMFSTILGTPLTAANTITPLTGFHHISGGTVIKTISAAQIQNNARLVLWSDDGATNWDATGNIMVAGTIGTTGKSQEFIYDDAALKWSPIQ